MAQDRAKEGVRLPYVLRHFDVSYLGICAPHVWIYCVAHRAGLDFGGVVIGIPLYIALSAFMLAVMLLAWKGKAQRVAPKLDWPLAALQADREYQELLNTACVCLLDCDSNVTRTAQALFLHINTIKYRLQRISDLLGYRLGKMPETIELYRSAAIYRLLHAQHEA